MMRPGWCVTGRPAKRGERAPVARGHHALHAVRTGPDGEQAVFVVERAAFGIEAQQRGAVHVGGGVRVGSRVGVGMRE